MQTKSRQNNSQNRRFLQNHGSVHVFYYIGIMTTINAPAYKGNFLEVFENTAMYDNPVNVWTEKGNAVIISEEEY